MKQHPHNHPGEVLMVEADFAGVVDALEEMGYVILDPDNHERMLGMAEQLASDLALRDNYNPNEVDPAGWPAITEAYQAEALTLLEAAIGRNERPR